MTDWKHRYVHLLSMIVIQMLYQRRMDHTLFPFHHLMIAPIKTISMLVDACTLKLIKYFLTFSPNRSLIDWKREDSERMEEWGLLFQNFLKRWRDEKFSYSICCHRRVLVLSVSLVHSLILFFYHLSQRQVNMSDEAMAAKVELSDLDPDLSECSLHTFRRRKDRTGWHRFSTWLGDT